MKVRELISELEKHDPDSEVFILYLLNGTAWDDQPVDEVEVFPFRDGIRGKVGGESAVFLSPHA